MVEVQFFSSYSMGYRSRLIISKVGPRGTKGNGWAKNISLDLTPDDELRFVLSKLYFCITQTSYSLFDYT
jgi:hypothetical protein